MPNKEVFTSVDVESSGPIPGIYSMLSFGACNVDNLDQKIYREFKPISKRFVPEALRVTGFSLDELMEKGVEPKLGMEEIAEWVNDTAREGRPVFTAFNATYDWQFPNYYFHRFLSKNPFGISGLDIKAYYMGKFGTSWAETTKRRINPIFLSDKPHTHNALDDAIEQAVIFKKIRDHK